MGLSLILAYGKETFQELLAGFHDMAGLFDYGLDVRYVVFSCQYLKLVTAAEDGVAVRYYLDAVAGDRNYKSAERQTKV